MKNIRYTPKIPTALAYFVLLTVAGILFMGRKKTFARIDIWPDIFPDFYQHVSNFSISYILFSGIGYVWLMLGVGFKYILALGAMVALANFVYELFISVLNTPDVVDAYYGWWGTLLAFVFLIVTKRYGLTKNSASLG